MDHMIIIGDGVAAISAVKAIREVKPEVMIDLFGEEPFYPYYRTKLSKNLVSGVEEADLLLQRKDWYESNKVRLHLNVRVQGVDVSRQEIILPGAERLHYDRLLLANGALNRPLSIAGAEPGKAHTIRSLADVKKLRVALEDRQVILYIGGGVLGLETAWFLQQYHKKVIIAEIQNRLFPCQLDEKAAAFLQRKVESFGIEVRTNTEIVRLIGDQAVEAVETKDGTRLACDLVLYSIGIKPNIDILKGTPIRTNRGVLVDDQMQTNIANVYAAGDVAEYQGKIYGLWSVAAAQGKTAGYNMAGRVVSYQPVAPLTTVNAFGTSLFSIGDISETGATRSVSAETAAANIYRRFFIRDQRIVGAIVIGEPGKLPLLKKAIEQAIPLGELGEADLTVDEVLKRVTKQP